MGGDGAAVLEAVIAQEALVAREQGRPAEREGEAHGRLLCPAAPSAQEARSDRAVAATRAPLYALRRPAVSARTSEH